jgi:hypothetical protein
LKYLQTIEIFSFLKYGSKARQFKCSEFGRMRPRRRLR